ncbi:Fur family transcriptional regulator [Streptacidiphilus sp. EB103A]|uniref:Fur family transcriptional regulator n=1 Tax=Streptacidiphilus sp. EB103A TaxID=3156275 RepID=UPI0035121333
MNGTTPRPEVELIGRATQQRTTVLRALIATDGFVSAQVLHARLISDEERVGLSTIYRTLTALAEAGRADVVRDPGGERQFRYRPGADHRHYLICRQCGLSLPVDSAPVETWADQVGEEADFADVVHTVELTGTCATCRAEAREHT